MQPSSREMQGITAAFANGGLAHSSAAAQIALRELQSSHGQQQISSFVHGGGGGGGQDDFLDQMLSGLPSAWAELGAHKSSWDSSEASQFPQYDDSSQLANRLRQHQISGGSSPTGKDMLTQQHMFLSAMGRSPATSGDSGLLPLPLTLGSGGYEAHFKSNVVGGDGLYNGIGGMLQCANSANPQSFLPPKGGESLSSQNFGVATSAAGVGQAPVGSAMASAGGCTGPPRQKMRARRGQATDPHSIAERLRRERIAERMKALQELVPNANKTDKASMLDEIIDYVKFLQLQVKVLSMSRLGGAAAVAPLVGEMSSEGQNGAGRGGASVAGGDTMTVAEHQVAKLMEEDMGSAMQYLQGKGLCLMPISLASAISTATACNPHRSPASSHALIPPLPMPASTGDCPTSPAASALSAQSVMANGGAADAAKEGSALSKA